MDLEERVEALENDMRYLLAELKNFAKLYLEQSGESQAYRHAVLALVAHPIYADNDLLRTVLRDDMARTEALYVGEASSDEQVTGLQRAQNVIMLALEESRRLRLEAQRQSDEPAKA